ncbi:SLC13 family permease [Halopelagius longus]|uniref:Anion transporter n=1 Tax=Halopelagius longus TaxID=1236180 RepID=A0A1H1FQB0_9EURY|nr:SLC13 family permease [Halopelagius longus]RDI69983.1 SLC13 family permease [Halopelagius longus]SDR03101.1 anion transporter [Halopelagius longus]
MVTVSPASRRAIRQGVGIGGALASILWTAVATPPAGMTPAMQTVFGVFGFVLVLWLTAVIPYVVSSTLGVTLLFALGAVETYQAATAGFASTIVFFLLLVFLLGEAIRKVDLDSWFASRLVAREPGEADPVRLVALNVLALAFVMPSAVARAITFIPVVREMADAYGLGRGSAFERSSFLVIGHVNPIASMALMTGGGMAIVTSNLIRRAGRSVTWVEWGVLMIPPVLLLYGLTTLTAEYRYADGSPTRAAASATASDGSGETVDVDVAPALTTEQRFVGTVLLGAVVLWIVGSFVGVPTIVPAVLAVAVLSLPRIGVLASEDVASVSWGILFVVGAMFSILDAMQSTGALAFLVETTTGLVPFAAFSMWQSVAVLLALAAFVRIFFSTASAAIVVTLPVLLQFGSRMGINQLYLGLSTLIVVGSTTIFPFNTTSVLVSLDRGPLSTVDVVSFGLVTLGYATLVVAVSWLVYWPTVTSLL